MGNGNKAEMLIAVCAVLTSVIALFVAWDQGRVMRAQQHGAVFPVLQVDGYVSRLPDQVLMGVRVSNTGVGPALIESVSAWEGEEKLQNLDAFRAALPDGADVSWTSMTGRSLAPGATVDTLTMAWPREAITDAQIEAVAAEWSKVALDFCYCSVFDRCWSARDLSKHRAVRVPKCVRGESDIFESFSDPLPALQPAPDAPPAETQDPAKAD
ncbi:MAG TPA: hypothetical protein PLR76_06330 [Hyphomonas sp.]|nr:hypothetical protein [Hyphomonas sp.]MCA8904386.1 hypothetical protein [Hyphomonas sp.]MCB9961094.1 hypothetical protein [Hyphomonas sp.]MCB9970385.1 hypothetical protein [Hyphomonas sp.]HPE47990.1 hypothetical protein [Hyphomonas sp.]